MKRKHFLLNSSVMRSSFATAAMMVLLNAGYSQAQDASAASDNMPSLTNVARQGEPGAPYINSWLLLGTFDNDAQNSGYDRDFIGEANAAPQAGATAGGQTWRYFDDRLFSRNYDDYQDLFSYYGVKQSLSSAAKVVYAHVYVWSPRAQAAQLRVGADTSFKAWINSAPVAGSTASTPESLIRGEKENLNSGRDYVANGVSLQSGWNRLLLKVANREAGRFGFYARLTTASGDSVSGLAYSTGGGSGRLSIANSAMPEAKTAELPTAWREWSYISARPDHDHLLALSKGKSGPNGQQPPILRGIRGTFNYNASLGMQASPFHFIAVGGSAPYKWSKAAGDLPGGLTLAEDGTLSGTPTAAARLGDYKFTVEVRDVTGATARREYSLPLKERPNRWVEQGRLTALIHGPEKMQASAIPEMARLMKRRGYALGMPIAYNNGEVKFRYPSAFGPTIADDDRIALFKTALEDADVGFGMYMGNLNLSRPDGFPVNQQVLMMQEAIERYHPKALWFDWLGLDGNSLDSLFSVIRSYDPNIVILLNGSERVSNGDWDVICFEGWGAWGAGTGGKIWSVWPTAFPWPKKHAPETWRLMVQPGWTPGGNVLSDWRETLRMQLSLIGEGFIANIDHTSGLTGNLGGSLGQAPSAETDKLLDMPLMQNHAQMANWANPTGKPALTEAYTNVDPGPLDAGVWGYNMMNARGDAVYLIALRNPRGKTGLPADGRLSVGPLLVPIKSVTWMNSNVALPFTQNATNGEVAIDTKSVQADEIATIIKITVADPLPDGSSRAVSPPVVVFPPEGVPAGNVATGKPSWLMSADDTHELTPSGFRNYAINGVDGDLTTTAQGAWEWAWSYKVDLQRMTTIRRVVVNMGSELYATHYKILVSVDGKEWKAVAEVEGNTGGGAKIYNIEAIQARFVRVQSLKPDAKNQTGVQMGITELQVFETAQAGVPITPTPAQQTNALVQQANLAKGRPSWLRSLDDTRDLRPSSTNAAPLGVDGDKATWAQGGGEWPWSYKVDLQRAATISRIVIDMEPNRFATHYKVLVSLDGKEWKTVADVPNNTTGGVKTHTFVATQARYVRVQSLKPDAANQTGFQMGISELQVFEK